MEILLPQQLTLQQCINPPQTIQINFCQQEEQLNNPYLNQEQIFKIVTQLKNNLPDSNCSQEGHVRHFPQHLVKIFCLIKINSLCSFLSCLKPCQSRILMQLMKIYNEDHLHDIQLCFDQREIMSQVLLKIDWTLVGEKCPKDLDNYLDGHALLTAIACWMYKESENFLKKEEIAFALSFVALHGRDKAYTPIVHEQKNHQGQIYFARKIKEYVQLNKIPESGIVQLKVQDPYSMRCSPHVHGVGYDLLTHMKQEIEQSINQPHLKYVCINGQRLPNLLSSSDTLCLKIDFLKCSLQQIGAQSFLRSERILNSYLGKNKLQTNKKQTYNHLWPMLNHGIQLTSQNKILSEMGNFDTMNIHNYEKDIYFQTGGYYVKCKKLLDNLYYLMTLQILSSCSAIIDTHPENHKILFKNETIKNNFDYFCKYLNADSRKDALNFLKAWPVEKI